MGGENLLYGQVAMAACGLSHEMRMAQIQHDTNHCT